MIYNEKVNFIKWMFFYVYIVYKEIFPYSKFRYIWKKSAQFTKRNYFFTSRKVPQHVFLYVLDLRFTVLHTSKLMLSIYIRIMIFLLVIYQGKTFSYMYCTVLVWATQKLFLSTLFFSCKLVGIGISLWKNFSIQYVYTVASCSQSGSWE
jgi:hypothetical protein